MALKNIPLGSTAENTKVQVNKSTGRLELISDGKVVQEFKYGLNEPVNLSFADGSATLEQTGAGTYVLKNPNDPESSVTVDSSSPQTGSGLMSRTSGGSNRNTTSQSLSAMRSAGTDLDNLTPNERTFYNRLPPDLRDDYLAYVQLGSDATLQEIVNLTKSRGLTFEEAAQATGLSASSPNYQTAYNLYYGTGGGGDGVTVDVTGGSQYGGSATLDTSGNGIGGERPGGATVDVTGGSQYGGSLTLDDSTGGVTINTGDSSDTLDVGGGTSGGGTSGVGGAGTSAGTGSGDQGSGLGSARRPGGATVDVTGGSRFGGTGVLLDASVENVSVGSAAENTTIRVNEDTGRLELVSGNEVVGTFVAGLNQPVNLSFADGSATLEQTGSGTYKLTNIDVSDSNTGSTITTGTGVTSGVTVDVSETGTGTGDTGAGGTDTGGGTDLDNIIETYLEDLRNSIGLGQISADEAFAQAARELTSLRGQGYTISNADVATYLNNKFGEQFSADDIANYLTDTAGGTVDPGGGTGTETGDGTETGTGDGTETGTGDGTGTETGDDTGTDTGTGTGTDTGTGTGGGFVSGAGNIVVDTPEYGEINIMDYLGLQAGQPSFPVGTQLEPDLAQLEATDQTLQALDPDQKLATDGQYVATPQEITASTVTSPTAQDAVTATASTTDLVDQPEAAQMTAEKSLEQINAEADALQAARQELNEVDPKATVQGQLALLQEQFTDGEVPVWAQGAFRQVNALMAQRGIGGSTIAAEAITNALMQSALPIAQQDASFYQNVTIQNLSNEQQAEMAKFNARTTAIFNDQAAENAARSLNTQSENELAQFFAQLSQNVALTNTAQTNAMEQFNATAENQTNQFFAELDLTAETFNADAINELATFDAEQANIIAQFNANMKNQREQFNVQNQLAIDASNVQWRRDVNTQNTAATNAALQFDAQNLLAVQQTALNNIWQHYDQLLSFAFTSEESAKDRALNLTISSMNAEMQRQISEDSSFLDSITGIVGGAATILGSDTGFALAEKWGLI